MRPDPNGTRRGLSAGRRRGLALLALALCLALPFAAFAGWDGWLFTHPLPARAEDARDLSAAGRADPTACLLYAADRLLGVPAAGLGPAAGWSASEDPAALADAAGEAREILTRMEAAGLLDGAPCWQTWLGAPLPTAPASPETAAGALAYTAPGGLRGLQVYDSAGQLALFWTPGGVPVYLNLERYDQPLTDPVSPGKLSAYLAFAGLEEFEDWQALDWSARLPDAGEAAYSPEAQLYATANTRAGLLLSLTSLSPEQAEALG